MEEWGFVKCGKATDGKSSLIQAEFGGEIGTLKLS
jgi:hypothetical protein